MHSPFSEDAYVRVTPMEDPTWTSSCPFSDLDPGVYLSFHGFASGSILEGIGTIEYY